MRISPIPALIIAALVPACRVGAQVPGKPMNDPAAYTWVRGLLDRVVDQTGWSRGQFKLTLLDAPEVNAFAGAKGDVYVTEGMLRTVGNDDELAAVLAHEVTHVTRRHVANQMQKQLLTGGAIAVLTAVTGSSRIAQGARVAGGLASLQFSRSDEEEADEVGFDYFVNAGFAPAGFISMLEKLGANARTPGFLDFMSSHPHSSKRATAARHRTAALPVAIRNRRPRLSFDRYASAGTVATPATPAPRSSSQTLSSPDPADRPIGWLDEPDRPPPAADGWRTITLPSGRTLQIKKPR